MSAIKKGYKQTKVGIIPDYWEVVSLNDGVSFLDHKRKPLKDEDRQKIQGQYPYYGASGIIDYVNDYIFDEELILIGEDGANIIDRSSRLVFLANGKYWVNNHAHVLKSKQNFNNYFLCEYLESLKYDKYNTGTAQPKLNKEIVSNIPIIKPPLKEQEKIAEILTTWDEAITKQTELLRAKELQKKALMQKLLSGEFRFSGFSDEWEEVRLGEIGEFKTSSIDKIINENERLVNLINYMDVYRNKHIDKNFRCSKTSLKEEQYEKVNLKKGDILFTPSSETPDDIGHSAVIIEDLPNTVYSYHLVRFRPKKSIDLKFSGYVFNNIDILKEFAKRANGSTRFTLSIKDFNETKAKLPSLLEQHKIAEVLSLADDEINLLKNELEELKLQKKALMQKLLAGQVRVKV